MHFSPKHLAFAAAAVFSSTTSASPTRPSVTHTSSPPTESNSVNCSDASTGLAPTCWFSLNMTTYLNDWVATSPYNSGASVEGSSGSTNASKPTTTTPTSDNPFADEVTTGNDPSSFFRKRTVPRTAAAAPASGRCEGGKPFSTCFLKLQRGYGSGKSNCSMINTGGANGTCPAPRASDYSNDAQAFYATWNFYAINAYISTFHLAITQLATSAPAALSTAATTAAPGISYFESAGQTFSIDVALLGLLIKSTGGLALSGGQNTPFLTLLEQYPSTVTYGQTTPPSELATLMQGRLEQVVAGVMGDERVFVRVAGNGAFSTEDKVGVEALVRVLSK